MTRDAFKRFSVFLQYKPPGNAPPWDDGCAKYYYALLSEIPDSDADALGVAVGKAFRFRPDPSEILDLWRKASSEGGNASVTELVGRMLRLRAERGIHQRRIPDDPYCRWEPCEPAWSDPLMARLSYAMGGWTEFCSDDSPRGVLHGQLTRAAAEIVGNAGDEAIDRLRLEYRERRAALPRPKPLPEYLVAPAADGDRPDGGLVPMRDLAAHVPVKRGGHPAADGGAGAGREG